jgi:lysosomal alpha-mannosidase
MAQIAVVVFDNWASQEFILYENSEFVEVQWTVGPVPIDDNKGKEIILRYDTNIASQATFFTDANGREVLQRVRDYRPTWNYTVNEPVSGNYYPVNSRIYIKDSTRQLTVLTGKTKIEDFEIEIV